MGIFRGKSKVRLPDDIVDMMERLGRHEIDVTGNGEDANLIFQSTLAPLLGPASSDPEGLVAALADACVPVGGWTVYGADRAVVNLIGVDPPGTEWPRILDGSLEFLRANFVPPIRIPSYAWDHFIDSGGTANTWLPLRPTPERGATPITPLAAGERRRVVKLGPEPDANVVVVKQDGSEVVALINSRYSDDDPTRSDHEFKRAADLYGLFVELGWSLQVWDWADPEMEPFFPAPKALI